MRLYAALANIGKKSPPTLASRYTSSPFVLRNIKSGRVVDLTLSSCSSPQHEVQVVPSENPDDGEPKSQEAGQNVQAEECSISKIPVVPTTLNTSTMTLATSVEKMTTEP